MDEGMQIDLIGIFFVENAPFALIVDARAMWPSRENEPLGA
jgi:hypothetical protein